MDHGAAREGNLCADRGAVAEAHRAEAARGQELTRMSAAVVLRAPELMLTDVGRHDHIVTADFLQLLKNILRLNHRIAVFVVKAVFFTPAVDSVLPRGKLFRIGTLVGGFEQIEHVGDDFFHVADNRDIDFHAFGYRGRIDINMNNLAARLCKVGRQADNAVVESGTDCDQNVAVLHRHVSFVGSVHAHHAEELFIVGWHGTQPHQC